MTTDFSHLTDQEREWTRDGVASVPAAAMRALCRRLDEARARAERYHARCYELETKYGHDEPETLSTVRNERDAARRERDERQQKLHAIDADPHSPTERQVDALLERNPNLPKASLALRGAAADPASGHMAPAFRLAADRADARRLAALEAQYARLAASEGAAVNDQIRAAAAELSAVQRVAGLEAEIERLLGHIHTTAEERAALRNGAAEQKDRIAALVAERDEAIEALRAMGDATSPAEVARARAIVAAYDAKTGAQQ